MKGLIPTIKHFFKKHGATILTITSSVGVILTGVSAAKATPTAMTLLEAEKKRKGEELTIMEKVKTAAPAYIPTLLIGGSTISCIVGANCVNKRQQAALVGLYTLADSTLKEYKKAALETLGEEESKKIAQAVVQGKYDDEMDEEGQVHGEDEELFFDNFSIQFFYRSKEAVRSAENLMNDLIRVRGYATLAEYYLALGLPNAPEDNDIGWSSRSLKSYCGLEHIPFVHEYQTMNNGEECCCISTSFGPFPTSDGLF